MMPVPEVRPAEIEQAYRTLAELTVWVQADEIATPEKRLLVTGNYLIVSSMLPAVDGVERQKNFTIGLVAAGFSEEAANSLATQYFDMHTDPPAWRKAFMLEHVPHQQRGFGIIRRRGGIAMDENEFVLSVLETFKGTRHR